MNMNTKDFIIKMDFPVMQVLMICCYEECFGILQIKIKNFYYMICKYCIIVCIVFYIDHRKH